MKKTFKQTLVFSAVAALFSTSVMAADLPEKFTLNNQPIDTTSFDWTGAYAGVSLGIGFLGEFDNGAALEDDNATGFIGGGVVGYNYQIDKFVIGLEGDLSFTTLDAQTSTGLEAELDYLGTITGRVGYTPVERILTYVEGGYAFGQVDVETATASDDNFLNGFVVGAGAEYAINDQVTTGIEYNYINLSDDSFDLGPAGVQETDFDSHTIRLNFKYKF